MMNNFRLPPSGVLGQWSPDCVSSWQGHHQGHRREPGTMAWVLGHGGGTEEPLAQRPLWEYPHRILQNNPETLPSQVCHSWKVNPSSKAPLKHIDTSHKPTQVTVRFICRDINKSSEVKIVHTSVHGVGHKFVQAAFKAFDLQPPYAVEEQKDPDPEFPTVKYPNPEEGKGVLVCSK